MTAPRESSARVLEYVDSFFSSEVKISARLVYLIMLTGTLLYSAAAFVEPVLRPSCGKQPDTVHAVLNLGQGLEGGLETAPNPSYRADPCRWDRYAILLGMNPWECDMSRRIVLSLLLGSIIGFERRRADRPAGIRTMAMVCLGSCVFTLGR